MNLSTSVCGSGLVVESALVWDANSVSHIGLPPKYGWVWILSKYSFNLVELEP